MAKRDRRNVSDLYNAAIKEFRKLGLDSNGKWRYENALNKVCFDLFGKKQLGTKLGPNAKRKTIIKTVETFDFESLIAILADNRTQHKLYVAVLAKHALASGNHTSKEMKTIKKSYKKIIDMLSEQFSIEKASDDIMSELARVTDDYDDYSFDDDDDIFESIWEDDEGPFYKTSKKYRKSAKHKNELGKLLYGRGYDDDDDDEYDDDKDEEISKIVDVLENITDRLDSIESGIGYENDYDDYTDRRHTSRRRPVMNNPRRYRNPPSNDGWEPVDDYDDDDDYDEIPAPPPTPMEMAAHNDPLDKIIGAIDAMNTNIGSMSNALAETSRTVHGMKSDLAATMKNVADIMNDLYEDDEPQQEAPPQESPPAQYPIRDSDKKNPR